jgi:hypothetical protein
VSQLDNYLVASNFTNEDRKRTILLHFTGEAVHDIFDMVPGPKDTYVAARACLKNYFSPKKNGVYETHVFW